MGRHYLHRVEPVELGARLNFEDLRLGQFSPTSSTERLGGEPVTFEPGRVRCVLRLAIPLPPPFPWHRLPRRLVGQAVDLVNARHGRWLEDEVAIFGSDAHPHDICDALSRRRIEDAHILRFGLWVAPPPWDSNPHGVRLLGHAHNCPMIPPPRNGP